MEPLPLHVCRVHRSWAIINRSHIFTHFTASLVMIYHRASSFLYPDEHNPTPPALAWLVVFAAELLLCFIWLLRQALAWRPVSRTVFPERLPSDEELPPIDVFICTADPKKEPTLGVMNTVVSAMALDYPPEKLSVYLSDDGGSSVTQYATWEAWRFARLWLPFCKRYAIETRCPQAYFSTDWDNSHSSSGVELFVEDRKKIERKYEEFRERLRRAGENGGMKDGRAMADQNRPPVVEVIGDEKVNTVESDRVDMPLLVYVSREKNASIPHHFKAGALNVLLRVSGVISNAPYLLMLDCDMYSNDPKSARQAMCFHLDFRLSPSLAFVQFPQAFHNISKSDIYTSEMISLFSVTCPGMDGLKGPYLCGTCFYMKRAALYATDNVLRGMDLPQLKQSFGLSNEFIKSLDGSYKRSIIDHGGSSKALMQHAQFLASCTYENETQWGQQIGFWYNSVVEDIVTGFILHCKGWTSVYYIPPRPAFLGSVTTNLDDTIIQNARWNSGLFDFCFSRFCPIVYGPSRMSILQSMCYGCLAFQPLYCFPLWCLATIPQLCLLNGILIYPKVSSSWFFTLCFIFLSSILKYLWDVLSTGGSIQLWWSLWRSWMIKSVTAYLFGSLDAILKLIGKRKASFAPTNKAADDEQASLHKRGIFDFRTSTVFLAPMVTLVILNIVSFTGGIARAIFTGAWDEVFAQTFLSFIILIVNYAIIEGMVLRKDRGRVPLRITLLSIVFSVIYLCLGSMLLMHMR